MNLEQIRELIALMRENQIAEIDLESEGERLRVVAERSAEASPTREPAPTAARENAANERSAPAPVTLPEPAAPEIEAAPTIDSPIVGTFYRSSSPDAPPLVGEGDAFDEETVLCIVEAMKVMNEIKAETSGRIVKALVANGQPVEFGQPLFQYDPVS
jgi:acetyl-CoA carboxylase biotin carboxyl carrier protein